jgi:hypothetical protein
MKIWKIKICPICVVVSGTWILLLILRYFGQPIDLTLIALLMGGSVVGIAYTLEKKLPAGRSGMAWKFISIVGGFILVYGVLSAWWVLMSVGAIGAVVAGVVFLRAGKASPVADSKPAKELEDKMKQCC